MDELEEKYIELLFRCIKLQKNDILFLEYNSLNEEFANKIMNKAKNIGVKEIIIYIENNDIDKELINKLSIDELKSHPLSDTSIYDESAIKGAKFLRIISPRPNLYEDNHEKASALFKFRKQSRPMYYKKLHEKTLTWNIAIYPNKEWANFLFPDDSNSYEKLFNLIMKACGVDRSNPIMYWDNIIKEQCDYIKKLNDLNIKSLHYKNSLGTDLNVSLTDNTIWTSISDWDGIIVNMPSYEIFSNLDYRKTNGIVYSSMPLVYNNVVIDNFYLKFLDGRIIDFNAEEGYQALKSIIKTDELSHYLGEIALVSYNNPIRKLNQIFYETTFDENQAAHFSIGSGELECVKDIKKLSKVEVNEKGINISSNHVDFMIGTSDLEITAETAKGEIIIFKNGSWNI